MDIRNDQSPQLFRNDVEWRYAGPELELSTSGSDGNAVLSAVASNAVNESTSRFFQLLERVWFPMAWLFIGMVSSYDIYLTLKFQLSILQLERNPVGRFLLKMDGGDPSLFVSAKCVGTIFVLGILTLMYHMNRRMAYRAAIALAIFQFGLLCFLELR